jgi:hypothetical protein
MSESKTSFRSILFVVVMVGAVRMLSQTAGVDLAGAVGGAVVNFKNRVIELGSDSHFAITTILTPILTEPLVLSGLAALAVLGLWGWQHRLRGARRTGQR